MRLANLCSSQARGFLMELKLNYRLMGESERPGGIKTARIAAASFFKRMAGFKPFEFVDPITNRTYDVGFWTKHKFKKMLKVAAKSNPTPSQSKFFLYSSALSTTGKIVHASNHEPGICKGMHAEEAGTTAVLETGKNARVLAIAFAGDYSAPISPCGGCRDVISEYGTPDMAMLAGSPKGGKVFLTRAQESYFFDDFKPIPKENLGSANMEAVIEARKAELQAHSIYTNQGKVYGAAIVCRNGNIFRGSLALEAAYHPVYPITAAISNLRDSSDDPERLDITSLVIVQTGRMPNVPYLDRQHLLELVGMSNSIVQEKGPITVRMYELDSSGNIVRGAQTNSSEWIPDAFSVVQLGMEGELGASARKLTSLPSKP